MNDEAWVKEFREKSGLVDMKNIGKIKSLLAFISKVREEAKKEERERIREEIEKDVVDINEVINPSHSGAGQHCFGPIDPHSQEIVNQLEGWNKHVEKVINSLSPEREGVEL